MKRKRYAVLMLAGMLLAGGLLFAGGTGEVPGIGLEEFRSAGGFTRIVNGSSADLVIGFDGAPGIRSEGDRDLLESLRLSVEGNELRIRQTRQGLNWLDGRATLYINVRELEALTLAGTGDAIVEGVIRGEQLDLITSGTGDITAQARVGDFSALISGTGNMDLRVIAEESELRLTGVGGFDIALVTRDGSIISTGAGSIDIEGQGEYIDLRLTGAGSLRGEGFAVERLDAALTGAGSAELVVTEEVNVRLTGVGNLRISGTAEIGDLVETGIGRFQRIP
jgi:hypothetical protein